MATSWRHRSLCQCTGTPPHPLRSPPPPPQANHSRCKFTWTQVPPTVQTSLTHALLPPPLLCPCRLSSHAVRPVPGLQRQLVRRYYTLCQWTGSNLLRQRLQQPPGVFPVWSHLRFLVTRHHTGCGMALVEVPRLVLSRGSV